MNPSIPTAPLTSPPPVPPPSLKRNSAPILLIALIMLVLGVLAGYFMRTNTPSYPPTSPPPTACTEEAKLCPDGSSVGRTGPNCEFAQCPIAQATPNPTDDRKTYKNTKYNYSISFPALFKTQVNSAGSKNQEASPDTDMLFIYESANQEPYLERYIEIQPHGQAASLGEEWQKSTALVGNVQALKFENPKLDTFVIYRLAIPDSSGELEIQVTKNPQKSLLANQILSTFKFLDQTTGASSWQTYKNTYYNFEIKYPSSWTGPFRASGTMQQGSVAFQGPEGLIALETGGGFGGGLCPEQKKTIISKLGEIGFCLSKDASGNENLTTSNEGPTPPSLSQIKITAQINSPTSVNESAISQILSTLQPAN